MNKTKMNGLGKHFTRSQYWEAQFDDSKVMRKEYRKSRTELKKTRNMIKQRKYQDIVEYMEYCEATGLNIAIVDKSNVTENKPQKEEYCFKEAFIDQYGGYTCDSFYGDIWIHLKGDKYLRFSYSM